MLGVLKRSLPEQPMSPMPTSSPRMKMMFGFDGVAAARAASRRGSRRRRRMGKLGN
jgi:hypothetical protein